ncbi:MAG: type II secretion system F family protein [Magnetospirillum sp. WYHS-4]
MGNLDQTQLILLGSAVLAVLAVASFALPFLKGRKRAQRIESVVTRRRGELSRQLLDNYSQAGKQRKPRQQAVMEVIQQVSRKLRLEGALTQDKTKIFLAQGGFRSRSALPTYAVARIAGIFAGIPIAMVLLSLMDSGDTGIALKMGIWVLGGFVGFNMPKILVSNVTQKRQQEMGRAFPDALDLMVICVEAGLSIEGAFDRVTREIAEASPILAQEIGLTSAELAFLGDRSRAYQNFADRTGLPAVKSLSTTLIQTERYGTPVGVALRVLSQEKRHDRMSTAEKKAASLPAKLTVPMIVFFLPVLFVVVLGPAIIQTTRM